MCLSLFPPLYGTTHTGKLSNDSEECVVMRAGVSMIVIPEIYVDVDGEDDDDDNKKMLALNASADHRYATFVLYFVADTLKLSLSTTL